MFVSRIPFIVLLLCISTTSFAYTDSDWTRIVGPSGDVSFSVPPGFLVDKEGDICRIFVFNGDAGITLTIDSFPDGKMALSLLRQHHSPDEVYSEFAAGEAEGAVLVADKERSVTTVFVASGKFFYKFVSAADTSTNPVLVAFLNSIRVAGQPLIKQNNPGTYKAPGVRVADLKISPDVERALAQKNEKVKVEYIKEDEKSNEISEPRNKYSRPFFILRKPKPDSAHMSVYGKRAVVKLRLSLRADGSIDWIGVLRGIDEGLTHKAIKAAKGIRFLPAEVDGKPVDSTATIEYNFRS